MLLPEFCEQQYGDLKTELQRFPIDSGFTAESLSQIVSAVFKALKEIRLFLLEHPFESVEQEVLFFKEIKPRFTCELIFYCSLHHLICRMPREGMNRKKALLLAEMEKLSEFFPVNQQLYDYWCTKAVYMDTTWFSSRGEYCPGEWLAELSGINRDPDFSSARDHIIAAFMAYDRLLGWCELQLRLCENKDNIPLLRKLPWTAGAIDLVEMVYGFYLAGAVDHGRVSLADIFTVLEQVFDVKLDNFSYLFSQTLRFRKSGSIKFLEEMRAAIEIKLDELDTKGRVKRNRTQD